MLSGHQRQCLSLCLGVVQKKYNRMPIATIISAAAAQVTDNSTTSIPNFLLPDSVEFSITKSSTSVYHGGQIYGRIL
ncbi:hypothetical protein ACROYT_G012638 [Oculina patagonica]